MINGYTSGISTPNPNVDGNGAVTVSIPTFKCDAVKNEVRMPEMRASDLENLRAKDPFLYYSIPSVRERAMKLKDIPYDSSFVGNASQHHQNGAIRLSNSEDVLLPAQTIDRKSRISFEGHVDMVFFEMLDECKRKRGDHEECDILDDALAELLSENTQSKSRVRR